MVTGIDDDDINEHQHCGCWVLLVFYLQIRLLFTSSGLYEITRLDALMNHYILHTPSDIPVTSLKSLRSRPHLHNHILQIARGNRRPDPPAKVAACALHESLLDLLQVRGVPM